MDCLFDAQVPGAVAAIKTLGKNIPGSSSMTFTGAVALGLNHIELLTGQPAQTVRGFMGRQRIPGSSRVGFRPPCGEWRNGGAGLRETG